MSADHSFSKRSQSVLSEADDVPKGICREYFSDRGSLRKKPIRKSKFLSRKQVMFRYMEKVEMINKKLRDMQRIKLKRNIYNQKCIQKISIMNFYQNINTANRDMYNDLSSCENNLRNLLMNMKFKSTTESY